MRTIRRYLWLEIASASLFVLFALLALHGQAVEPIHVREHHGSALFGGQGLEILRQLDHGSSTAELSLAAVVDGGFQTPTEPPPLKSRSDSSPTSSTHSR